MMAGSRRTAPLRKGSHWAPKMPKWALIEDINEWITETTGDNTDALKDGIRISRRDLETLARAINYAKAKGQL